MFKKISTLKGMDLAQLYCCREQYMIQQCSSFGVYFLPNGGIHLNKWICFIIKQILSSTTLILCFYVYHLESYKICMG